MTNEELLKLAYTRELTDERVIVAAAYWLDASPHEQIKADGVILARYARQAMETIERMRAALEEINSAKGSYAGVTCRVIARAALSHQTEQPSQHVELRPELLWFAQQMELTLRANDHKGGWDRCSLQYLFEKLDEEVGELSATLSNEETIREATDVANVVMMIADLARQPAPKGEDGDA